MFIYGFLSGKQALVKLSPVNSLRLLLSVIRNHYFARKTVLTTKTDKKSFCRMYKLQNPATRSDHLLKTMLKHQAINSAIFLISLVCIIDSFYTALNSLGGELTPQSTKYLLLKSEIRFVQYSSNKQPRIFLFFTRLMHTQTSLTRHTHTKKLLDGPELPFFPWTTNW